MMQSSSVNAESCDGVCMLSSKAIIGTDCSLEIYWNSLFHGPQQDPCFHHLQGTFLLHLGSAARDVSAISLTPVQHEILPVPFLALLHIAPFLFISI